MKVRIFLFCWIYNLNFIEYGRNMELEGIWSSILKSLNDDGWLGRYEFFVMIEVSRDIRYGGGWMVSGIVVY